MERRKAVIETGKGVMFEATPKPAIGSGTSVSVWGVMAQSIESVLEALLNSVSQESIVQIAGSSDIL